MKMFLVLLICDKLGCWQVQMPVERCDLNAVIVAQAYAAQNLTPSERLAKWTCEKGFGL